MTAPTVPPLPPVAAELAERRREARAAARAAADRSTPGARAALAAIQHRLAVEAIANVGPALSAPTGPVLLPPRRRFLTPEQRARSTAVERAMRTAMLADEVDDALPRVLHAAATTALDWVVPGRYRTGASAWRREDEPIEHPPAEHCAELVAAAIDLVRRAPADPADLAAWLAFTVMTVHPFEDGNGRVARLLTVAAGAARGFAAPTAPLEWWAVDRVAYVEALRAGQPRRPYAGHDRSAAAFVDFAARAEIAACRLGILRLGALEEAFAEPELDRLDPALRPTLVRLLVDGWLDPGIADADLGPAIDLGWVRRVRRPASLPADASGRALVPGPSMPAGLSAWRSRGLHGAVSRAVSP